MKKITNYIIKIMTDSELFSRLELIKMEYGLICMFNEITKFIPFIIIFYLLSFQNYYFIALLFFCPIRIFTGGYHAKTYWGCFLISFISFLIIILIGKYIIISFIVRTFLLFISFICVCVFSPIENINKKIISEKTRITFKKYSIIIAFILSIMCYFIPGKFISTATISITYVSIMMIVEVINKRSC